MRPSLARVGPSTARPHRPWHPRRHRWRSPRERSPLILATGRSPRLRTLPLVHGGNRQLKARRFVQQLRQQRRHRHAQVVTPTVARSLPRCRDPSRSKAAERDPEARSTVTVAMADDGPAFTPPETPSRTETASVTTASSPGSVMKLSEPDARKLLRSARVPVSVRALLLPPTRTPAPETPLSTPRSTTMVAVRGPAESTSSKEIPSSGVGWSTANQQLGRGLQREARRSPR